MADLDGWRATCDAAALHDKGRLAVNVQGQPILLIEQRGTIYALHNRCPHLGCPLTRGQMEDHIIVCPCHDWAFDIRNGEFLHASEIKLLTFETRVASGKVYIKL